MPKPIDLTGLNSDAAFLGWQETSSGECFPLYTVTASGHPLYRSTVTDSTLREHNLRVPSTLAPYPERELPPWLFMEIALHQPRTAEKVLELAKLDYSVAKIARKSKSELNHTEYVMVRTDTDEILGFVSESYQPIQNIDAFSFFDVLVAEGKARYDSAGVFGKGERIWILAQLPGRIRVNGKDIVDRYLLLTNGHDGNSQVRVKIAPIRNVCHNTLSSALQGTGNFLVNPPPCSEQALNLSTSMFKWSNSLYGKLDEVFNEMAHQRLTEHQLREYVQALVPDNEENSNTERTERIRNSVLQLHESGLGAHLSRGTWWGAFNSVAEYTDHLMSREDPATRLNSIWFGHGEQLKMKAFQLARRMMLA